MNTSFEIFFGIVAIIGVIVVLLVVGNANSVLPKRV